MMWILDISREFGQYAAEALPDLFHNTAHHILLVGILQIIPKFRQIPLERQPVDELLFGVPAASGEHRWNMLLKPYVTDVADCLLVLGSHVPNIGILDV